ncbi:MAG TPA: hypothetical protein VF994_07765 [Myxococcales bacterium]
MANSNEKKFTVLEDPEIPTEILAQAIVDVASAAKKLLNGPLTRNAVIILVHAAAHGRVGKREVEVVLDAASSLDKFVLPSFRAKKA